MFPSIDLNSWNYYHEEFFVHFDFAIWIPIESFIIHFAIGPSFWIAGANSDYYDSNAYFKVDFDDWYNGGLTLGFNTKLGLSLNLNPFLIGFELNYMTSSIKEFFEKISKSDPNPNDNEFYGLDYLSRMGYFEFYIMIYFDLI